MRNFRKLQIWERSHNLALAIYKATADFPHSEIYGLTSQMRRASASIPANIAEGCGRDTTAEYLRFLQIAMGSATELDAHLLMAHDLGFLKAAEFNPLAAELREIKSMLGSYILKTKANPLNNKPRPKTRYTPR